MVLPVDPSLRTNEGESSTVTLPVLVDGLSAVNSDTSEVRQPLVVIAEGLSPILQKTLEKIQR